MSKISQYTRALKAKLSDLFVVASSDNGSLSTKAVTTEQIGDAIITEQTFSGLDGKTPAEAMADNTDNIGSLSQLTTTDKSSLVGAVNEVDRVKTNVFKDKIVIGSVTAGTKYDLFTLSNFTGGLVADFSALKGLMYLGGGGNANSYGYLFCNPITNIISYIPQVSDTNVSINIAVLY